MDGSKRLDAFVKAFAPVMDHPSPVLAISSFTGSSAAFAAAVLAKRPPAGGIPFVLAVTPGLPEADQLVDDLGVLEKECGVRTLEFPPELEDDPSATAARIKVAAALGAYGIRPYPLVVVAPVPALRKGVPAADAVAASTIRLEVGGAAAVDFASLQEKLLSCGYTRVPEVDVPGAFSVRGGVLDVWPPGAGRPFRAEYFGDELESLRIFDPATQTSTGKVASAEITPVDVPSSGKVKSLLETLPDGCTILWMEHNAYPEALRDVANAARRIYTGDPAPRDVPSARFQTSPLPGFAELGADAVRRPELLDAARARLAAHVDAARKRGATVSDDDRLSGGFEVDGLVVVTKSDRVFAHRRSYRGDRTVVQAG